MDIKAIINEKDKILNVDNTIDFLFFKNKIEPLSKDNIVESKPNVPHSGGATRGGANALKSMEDIQRLKNFFLEYDNNTNRKSVGYRNYALVVFALNCGKRAGDVLKTTIGNIMDENFNFKDYFYIDNGEEKTGKTGRIYINQAMKDAITLYLENDEDRVDNLSLEQPLFMSRERDEDGNYKSLSIRTYNYWLKRAQAELNFNGKISSHTCRKSMGRIMMDYSKPENRQNVLNKLQQMYNHNSQATTLRYLDITDDEIDKLHDEIQL